MTSNFILSIISEFIAIDIMIIEVNGKKIKNNRKFKVNMELKTEIKSNTINVSIVNLDEIKK